MSTVYTFRVSFSGRVIVYVGGDLAPDEDGWKAYVSAVRAHVQRHDDVVWLVWSGSSRPSSGQRQALLDVTPKNAPASVIIESVVARGVVTAFSWFMNAISPFPPDKIEAAYDHLRLTPEERRTVTQLTSRMQGELMGARTGT